jgi:hypothetical protein
MLTAVIARLLLPPGAAPCRAMAPTSEMAPRQNAVPAEPRRSRHQLLENSSIESANAIFCVADTIKGSAVSFEDRRALAGESDREINPAAETPDGVHQCLD